MNIAKFKEGDLSKGAGILTIEKTASDGKTVALLIFRNTFGAILFQGQLMKNLSKFIKEITPKAYKIKRSIKVVKKKADGTNGIIKCSIRVFI